jgi:hypothetical protein
MRCTNALFLPLSPPTVPSFALALAFIIFRQCQEQESFRLGLSHFIDSSEVTADSPSFRKPMPIDDPNASFPAHLNAPIVRANPLKQSVKALAYVTQVVIA